MRHPLDGVTVVSLEQAVAAPFATRQLTDLGARVIKIERRPPGQVAGRAPVMGPVPALGEHTEAIRAEFGPVRGDTAAEHGR